MVYPSEYKTREMFKGDLPIPHVKIGVLVNVPISHDCIRHSPLVI